MKDIKTGTGQKKTDHSFLVQKYLNDITKIARISHDEERNLGKMIKEGDQQAIDKLVNTNLRFVYSLAKEYQHQGLSLSDLINEGNYGLTKAAQRFDESKGFKFISYGVWWARQAILAALAEQSRAYRIPPNLVTKYTQANQTKLQFEQEHEREPTLEELSKLIKVSEKNTNLLLKINSRHIELDAPLSADDLSGDISRQTQGDLLLISDNEADAEMNAALFKKEVRALLNKLTPKQADVLTSVFKLDGDDSITPEAIVKKYKMKTIKSIQGVKDGALADLQKLPEAKRLRMTYGIRLKKIRA